MKKRICVLMLTLTLCLSLSVPALAAGGFRDVEQNAWYAAISATSLPTPLLSCPRPTARSLSSAQASR